MLEEQKGFCAYTERHVRENDSCHIEHFDDRRKGTAGDGYDNWYAVLPWSNERKPKIDKYLPVLAPDSAAVAARIRFDESGVFVAVNSTGTTSVTRRHWNAYWESTWMNCYSIPEWVVIGGMATKNPSSEGFFKVFAMGFFILGEPHVNGVGAFSALLNFKGYIVVFLDLVDQA